MTAPIEILVPCYRTPDLVRRCVRDVQRHTTTDYRLKIVDNGDDFSAMRSVIERAGLDADQWVRNGMNLGFGMALEPHVRQARSHVVLLNSDVLVRPGWLEAMTETLEIDPRIGIVGAVMRTATGTVQHAGAYLDAGFNGCHKGGEPLDYADHEYVCFGMVLLRHEMIGDLLRRHGEFFNRRYFAYYEDNDITMLARDAGWRSAVAPAAWGVHFHAMTTNRYASELDTSAMVRESRRVFMDRWGHRLAV